MRQSVREFVASVRNSRHEYNQKKKFLCQRPEDWVDDIIEYKEQHIANLKIRICKLEVQRMSEWASRMRKKDIIEMRAGKRDRSKNIDTTIKERAKEMNEADKEGLYHNGWGSINSSYHKAIQRVQDVLDEYVEKFPEYYI